MSTCNIVLLVFCRALVGYGRRGLPGNEISDSLASLKLPSAPQNAHALDDAHGQAISQHMKRYTKANSTPMLGLAKLLLGLNPTTAFQFFGSARGLPLHHPTTVSNPVAVDIWSRPSRHTALMTVSSDAGNHTQATEELPVSETAMMQAAREELLESLRPLKMGFEATREQTRETNAMLESFVNRFADVPEAQAGRLSGHWRLLYTDAPDILSINGGPLAELDFIGQDYDEEKGTCDNVIRFRPSNQVQSLLGSFAEEIGGDRLEQRVLLNFEKKPSSKRVEQQLAGIKVVPLRLLGGRITDDWAPPLGGTGLVTVPFGSYELLYNDDQLRIVRTVQGYFAVNERVNERYEPNIYRPPREFVAGKTILITGANRGLGFETAKRLAQEGARVVLTARTQDMADAAAADLNIVAGQKKALGLALDLASLESIRSFPARYNSTVGTTLDVLLANAGVMAIPEKRTTEDGFERQVGINHLGHFALVSGMMPALREAPNGCRVISVSSSIHRAPGNEKAINDDLASNLDPVDYGRWRSYGVSKVANVLFANELQRRFDAAGVRGSAVSLDPGTVNSDLWRYATQDAKLADPGIFTAEGGMNPIQMVTKAALGATSSISKGANTHVFVAAAADSDGELVGNGGKFFVDMKVSTPAAFTDDRDLAVQLWEVSEKLTGTKIDI